jgi:hypothetical protein
VRAPGPACGDRLPSHSPPATDTRTRGSSTPCPPSPGPPPPLHSFSHIRVCVCVWVVDGSLRCKASPFSACSVHLAVLGTVGGGLASSAHEWLLSAVIAQQRGIAAVALARCVLRPWHLVSQAPALISQNNSSLCAPLPPCPS